jgi:aryl carrier-like protein
LHHPDHCEIDLVSEIVNKYLNEKRDQLSCQEDLIDAGLKKYGKL